MKAFPKAMMVPASLAGHHASLAGHPRASTAAISEHARPSPASFALALTAAALVSHSAALPATALLPPDTSGTWAVTETRGGQKCSATLMLQPTRAPQSAEEMRRGAARYQGVCVDSADGSWIAQEGLGDGPARLAWRLEYEKSTVYFALDLQTSTADGALAGKGDVYSAPRAEPKAIKRVGGFEAKRLNRDWDLRDPAVAKRVTDKVLLMN
mgnify:CR=1 FL=1